MSKNKNEKDKSEKDKSEKATQPAPTPPKTEKPANTAVQPSAPGAVTLPDYGDDAGKGTEEMGGLQRAPIMLLLQNNSPQVQPGTKNVPNARGGMFFNPNSGELIPGDKGFLFVPAFYRRMAVEWHPRSTGGGFAGAQPWTKQLMSEGRAAKNDKGKTKMGTRILANGLERVDTHYLVGFIVTDDGEYQPQELVVLAMTSTKIGALQQWSNRFFQMKAANGKQLPLFSGLVRVTSRWEPKNQGYFAIVFQPAVENDYARSMLAKTHVAYEAGKNLYEMAERKEVEILYETAPDEDDDVGQPQQQAGVGVDGKRPF